MGLWFEELDWQDTAMGELSLRRRVEPSLGVDVYEVKLGDEYLMSSLFTVAEVELARMGLAEVAAERIDVLVGGLGLGYTAVAALEDARVQALTVVEAIGSVIDWHRRGLLPGATGLADDPRTRLLLGDFFALAAGNGFGPDSGPASGSEPEAPATYDAILLDIDHSPRHVLDPSHAAFYTPEGLSAMKRHLDPAGVFAMWSDDPPDEDFEAALADVFATTRAEVVTFPNPLTDGESSATVYVARD